MTLPAKMNRGTASREKIRMPSTTCWGITTGETPGKKKCSTIQDGSRRTMKRGKPRNSITKRRTKTKGSMGYSPSRSTSGPRK